MSIKKKYSKPFGDLNSLKTSFFENNDGMLNMAECIRAYNEVGFDGYVRVDHVPTMAGEENGRPGYEALGRLYAIGYLRGLLEMS